MNNLLLRRLGIVLGIAILAGAYSMYNYLGNQSSPPKRKQVKPSQKTVEVMQAINSEVASTLSVQGELIAYDKIDIFAEVSGTLSDTERPFKVGSYFPKGSVLIKVDDTEARLNLLSQKSSLVNSITQMMPDLKIDYPESYQNWKKYLDEFDVESAIKAFPEAVNDQEKYFIATRNLLSPYYNIKSQEERLSKYIIEAPFSGVITQTSINPGALVRNGQKLGELMNRGYYELEVTVPLSDLAYIKTGNPVTLESEDIQGSWTGRIKRINDQVDAGTQTVKVFIGISGKDLREGMYMQGDVAAKSIPDAMELPRKLLVNQNSLYFVEDTLLRLRQVDVVKITEESVIVKGVENGAPLLAEPVTGAFDGMPVQVKKANKREAKLEK